jgi:uncharacterized protein (DUF2126 family)
MKTKNETVLRVYKTENTAIQFATIRNKAAERAGNFHDIMAVVEHPEGFAMCDLRTAIETELPYTIYR